MKRFILIQLAALFLVSVSMADTHVNLTGLRFIAPTVTGKSNVYNPEPGEIVYDSSDSSFYGYSQTNTWLNLSASSTTDSVPVGTVMPFAGSTAPSGYLLADGSAISRTEYASLFAVIATTYGAGDGSTTFNLPDTRGVFVRGVGTQTIGSVSYSGTLGAKQNDQLQGHRHVMQNNTWNGGSAVGLYAISSGGLQNDPYPTSIAVGDPKTDGTNGTPRIGSETRPANIALKYIIKY